MFKVDAFLVSCSTVCSILSVYYVIVQMTWDILYNDGTDEYV